MTIHSIEKTAINYIKLNIYTEDVLI